VEKRKLFIEKALKAKKKRKFSMAVQMYYEALAVQPDSGIEQEIFKIEQKLLEQQNPKLYQELICIDSSSFNSKKCEEALKNGNRSSLFIQRQMAVCFVLEGRCQEAIEIFSSLTHLERSHTYYFAYAHANKGNYLKSFLLWQHNLDEQDNSNKVVKYLDEIWLSIKAQLLGTRDIITQLNQRGFQWLESKFNAEEMLVFIRNQLLLFSQQDRWSDGVKFIKSFIKNADYFSCHKIVWLISKIFIHRAIEDKTVISEALHYLLTAAYDYPLLRELETLSGGKCTKTFQEDFFQCGYYLIRKVDHIEKNRELRKHFELNKNLLFCMAKIAGEHFEKLNISLSTPYLVNKYKYISQFAKQLNQVKGQIGDNKLKKEFSSLSLYFSDYNNHIHNMVFEDDHVNFGDNIGNDDSHSSSNRNLADIIELDPFKWLDVKPGASKQEILQKVAKRLLVGRGESRKIMGAQRLLFDMDKNVFVTFLFGAPNVEECNTKTESYSEIKKTFISPLVKY